MSSIVFSAPVMALNLARLEEELERIEAEGISEARFDVSDGRMNPNLTLGPDFVRVLRGICNLPCHVHLLVSEPERFISQFADAECDVLTIPVETAVHAHRALAMIRERGISPGICINPATPLTQLEYLLPMVDRVVLRASEPGAITKGMPVSGLERLRRLRRNMEHREAPAKLEVCGAALDADGVAAIAGFGADVIALSGQILAGRVPLFIKRVEALRRGI